MKFDDVLAFAKKRGYNNIIRLSNWEGYEVYEPVREVNQIKTENIVGFPPLILISNNQIRMSTLDETYNFLLGDIERD